MSDLNWILIGSIPATQLTHNIMARVARQADITLANETDAYKLYNCVAWLTEDWPEEEGFGSSDSYQCFVDAKKAFKEEN